MDQCWAQLKPNLLPIDAKESEANFALKMFRAGAYMALTLIDSTAVLPDQVAAIIFNQLHENMLEFKNAERLENELKFKMAN